MTDAERTARDAAWADRERLYGIALAEADARVIPESCLRETGSEISEYGRTELIRLDVEPVRLDATAAHPVTWLVAFDREGYVHHANPTWKGPGWYYLHTNDRGEYTSDAVLASEYVAHLRALASRIEADASGVTS